ncbi:hypothetical protein BGZ92_002671, partial [Podila epicladia]
MAKRIPIAQCPRILPKNGAPSQGNAQGAEHPAPPRNRATASFASSRNKCEAAHHLKACGTTAQKAMNP